MGFNTVAVLYNDFTHEIEKSGPIGKRMASAMRAMTWPDDARRLHKNFGAGQVISQAHSAYDQVVVVGKNTGCPISEANDLDWLALKQIEDCLKRHGYTVKPPAKKRRAA